MRPCSLWTQLQAVGERQGSTCENVTGTTTVAATGPEEEPTGSMTGSAKRKEGRAYLCSKCKVPKKGHTCPVAPPEHSTSARRAKRARDE